MAEAAAAAAAAAASSSFSIWEEFLSTFVASVRSVGTACTLAGVGVYLHQRGFVVGNGKRTLAMISQQVTIPLLFFTKILYCNQDWSSDPCPNVTESLTDVWILLLWPVYVCSVGLIVGYACAKFAKVPSHQVNSMLAAVGFGNSTGLPITLLTVIHSNFPSNTNMGRIDPTLFLSVYLLLYPVLQWGIGGWLLAPPEKAKKQEQLSMTRDDSVFNPNEQPLVRAIRKSSKRAVEQTSQAFNAAEYTLAHNVLNHRVPTTYLLNHRGLDSIDASLYMSVQENLSQWGVVYYASTKGDGGENPRSMTRANENNDIEQSAVHPVESIGMDLSGNTSELDLIRESSSNGEAIAEETFFQAMKQDSQPGNMMLMENQAEPVETTKLLPTTMTDSNKNEETESQSSSSYEEEHLCETCTKVIKRCLQPPVVGALLGLFFASFPTLRGILVDIVDRTGDAPLEWFFDGLYTTGQAAVPLNMMILGCNLSASYMLDSRDHKEKFFSKQAEMAVVVGKMIVMPCIGFFSAYVMQFVYPVPDEIAGSFYLVLLIVFLCPTANNVMVMVELSGGGSKEGMARIIAYEYMVAPIILSLTVTGSVLMASSMSVG